MSIIDSVPDRGAVDRRRLLDTRRPPLSYVVGKSSGALDSQNRLVRGGWLDLGVLAASNVFSAQGVFVNVTVTQQAGPLAPAKTKRTVRLTRTPLSASVARRALTRRGADR